MDCVLSFVVEIAKPDQQVDWVSHKPILDTQNSQSTELGGQHP